MGEVSDEDLFKIPAIEESAAFYPDNFLPATGQCPSPIDFNVFGFNYTFKYDPLCRFAEDIRFMILILAAIISAKIIFGSLKKN